MWGASGGCKGDLEGGGGGVLSRGYAVSAPVDRDASQLYYSYLIISVGGRGGWWASGGCGGGGGGGGVGGGGGGGGVRSRSYAVSAPADRDASQLYYSYIIISVGGRGVWGGLWGLQGGYRGGGGGESS